MTGETTIINGKEVELKTFEKINTWVEVDIGSKGSFKGGSYRGGSNGGGSNTELNTILTATSIATNLVNEAAKLSGFAIDGLKAGTKYLGVAGSAFSTILGVKDYVKNNATGARTLARVGIGALSVFPPTALIGLGFGFTESYYGDAIGNTIINTMPLDYFPHYYGPLYYLKP